MATITSFTKSGNDLYKHVYVSGAATSADTIDLSGLEAAFPHCFLGVKMFDGAGDEITDGSATGTFTVQVGTQNSGHLESPPTSTIDAAAPVTVDWAGNTERVTVSLAGASGITTWQVVISMNRS